MAITLYDAVPSSNCDRVKIVLHYKGLTYETVRIDLKKKEQKKPEFLKLNPYGKVPVIVDDGKVLYESTIINEYLDEKYPTPPLMPKNPHARGQVRLFLDYGLNFLNAPYGELRTEILKKEEIRNTLAIEEKRQTLRKQLQYLDDQIGDRPYLMGELSLADIGLVTRFFRMETFGVFPAPSLPRLGTWLDRMKEHPSVKSIL